MGRGGGQGPLGPPGSAPGPTVQSNTGVTSEDSCNFKKPDFLPRGLWAFPRFRCQTDRKGKGIFAEGCMLCIHFQAGSGYGAGSLIHSQSLRKLVWNHYDANSNVSSSKKRTSSNKKVQVSKNKCGN